MDYSKHEKKILLICLILSLCLLSIFYLGFNLSNRIKNGNVLASSTIRYEQIGDDLDILILGDSLAYGVGSSSPEKSIAGQIGLRLPNSTIVNKAKSGSETSNIAKDLAELIDRNYDLIFIVIAGNDIVRPSANLEESKNNLTQIIGTATSKSKKTYLVTTGNFKNVSITSGDFTGYYISRADKIREHALELSRIYDNLTYIDTYNIPEYEYKLYESADGFHLNDLGVKLLVDRFHLEDLSSENLKMEGLNSEDLNLQH